METPQILQPKRPTYHPLMMLAALAVVVFCMVGTAAIMGWLPSSAGGSANRQLTEAERMALSAGMLQGTPAVAPPAAPQYAAPAVPAPYPAQPYAQQAVPPAAVAPARERIAERKPAPVPATDSIEGSRWCSNCGNIESVRAITKRAEGSGLGAAGGAVLGGLLGNQVGGGSGRQIATVAGAVGGAVVGNQVEGNMRATTSYEIRVRLDDGTLRTFRQSSQPSWRNGERVRIVNGKLRRA